MPADPEERRPLLAPTAESLSKVKIWPLIIHIRRDITESLDTALSWEQLTASDVNFTIIRPLVLRYASLRNMATGEILLQGHEVAHKGLKSSHSS